MTDCDRPSADFPDDCVRARALLAKLAQGRGTPEDSAAAEAHIRVCAACTEVRRDAIVLTCAAIAAFLDDVITDRLPAAKRIVFESHLAICPDCVRYMIGFRSSVELTRGVAAAADPPPDMPAQLIQAILAARAAGEAGED